MTRSTNERETNGRDGSDVPLYVLRRGDGSNELSFDDVFALLATRRRRFAVHYLSRAEDVAALAAIAEQVAVWERGGEEPASDEHAERVERDLRNRHLPALADANVAEFDERNGDVRYRGHPVVEEFVAHVAPAELPE